MYRSGVKLARLLNRHQTPNSMYSNVPIVRANISTGIDIHLDIVPNVNTRLLRPQFLSAATLSLATILNILNAAGDRMFQFAPNYLSIQFNTSVSDRY
jgi:hypothetical protein